MFGILSATLSAVFKVIRKADLTVEGTSALSSVDLNPTTVVGQTVNVTGTVTLTGPAPPGGMSVSLFSKDTSIVSVPPSVNVLAGSSTARFSVSTKPVSDRTAVTIMARGQGVERMATLAVKPPTPLSLEFVPSLLEVFIAVQSTGTITLDGPAPSGTLVNIAASLTSTAGGATVANTLKEPTFPVNMLVQAGRTQISFQVMMEIFDEPDRVVIITASYLGKAVQGNLTVTHF